MEILQIRVLRQLISAALLDKKYSNIGELLSGVTTDLDRWEDQIKQQTDGSEVPPGSSIIKKTCLEVP